jgi:peptidyl-prolyl cis-trans isomerase A (cyclophilin A)
VTGRWVFVLTFLAYLFGPSRAPAQDARSSLATAPVAAVLNAVYPSVPPEDRERWALRLACALCCAGAVAITFLASCQLTRPEDALILAGMAAFATPLWSWTSRADAPGALACLMVASLLWVWLARPRSAASAGGALGALVLAPWLLAAHDPGARIRPEVIAAYLASPGRGLLFFAPIAPLAVVALLRRDPPRRILLGGTLVLAAALLELAARREPWGPLGFGPTLLAPYVPILAAIAGCLPRTWIRVGALLSLPAALAHGTSVLAGGHTWDERRRVAQYEEAVWDFRDSPFSDLAFGSPRPDLRRLAAIDHVVKDGDQPTRAGASAPWLAYGWESPEPGGTWASGAESWIVVGAPPGDYVLTLTATAPAQRGRRQRLTVERPAEDPLTLSFSRELWQLEALRVPFRAVENLTVLKLHPAHTWIPGHGDARPLSLFLAALRLQGPPSPDDVVVFLETELGRVELALDTRRAPATAANFLRYVDAGHYDGGLFHRSVKPDNQPDNAAKIEVIQGGMDPARKREGFGPIAIERTRDTGLRHLDATLSMARTGPDSATSDFFICIGDQPSLDFGGARNPDGQGFAAFGRVLAGMDVVRRIQAAPAQAQRLTPPVRILKARRR